MPLYRLLSMNLANTGFFSAHTSLFHNFVNNLWLMIWMISLILGIIATSSSKGGNGL